MSGVQARITAAWDAAANGYDDQPGHEVRSDAERRAWHDLLRAALPPAPADVLDAGTGTGFLARRAAELGHRVTGIDLSRRMLEVARIAPPPREVAIPPAYVEGDAVDPPFPDAAFDAIVSRHVLWTLREPDATLARWHDLLRPGGRLLVVDGLWAHAAAERAAETGETGASAAPAAESDPFYTDDVLAALPLLRATDVAAIAARVARAGFVHVAALDLAPLDRAEGGLPGNRGRYALRAVRSTPDRAPPRRRRKGRGRR